MSWTYLPGTMRDLDRVRLLIGDTNADAPQLQDEEVQFFVAEAGNVYGAAVQACEALAAKYARDVNRAVAGDGGVRVDAGERAQHYRDLAVQLTRRARKAQRPVPFAGGISVAQKEAQELDDNRVEPAFTVDQHTTQPRHERPDEERP